MDENVDEILEAEVVDIMEEPPNYPQGPERHSSSRKGKHGTRKKDFARFTPEVRETILQVTRIGAPPQYAAKFAGVAPSTLLRWLERGRNAQRVIDEGNGDELAPVEKDFANFFIAYNETVSKVVVGLLGTLQRQARRNPNVALKLLEKLDPEQFGQRQAIDMNVAGKVGHLHVNAKDLIDGGEVAKQLTTEELRALRESIKKRKQLKAGSKDGDA